MRNRRGSHTRVSRVTTNRHASDVLGSVAGMETTETPDHEGGGVSRAGLLLGAAGLAGAGALAALPGAAQAAPARGPSQPLHAGRPLQALRKHPHYNRANFERANAVVTLSDGTREMTARVEHVAPLREAEGERRGSAAWAGGFSVLLKRTKGARLPGGTYTAAANGKRFSLHVSEIGPGVYQAIINRFTPGGR